MLKKLTFSEQLYLGESISQQNLDKLKDELLSAPLFTKVFIITLSTNPTELLDILESKYLTFPYYNTHPLHVVGIAKSNNEAIGLTQKIVQDCLDKRGDVDLRSFFLETL